MSTLLLKTCRGLFLFGMLSGHMVYAEPAAAPSGDAKNQSRVIG